MKVRIFGMKKIKMMVAILMSFRRTSLLTKNTVLTIKLERVALALFTPAHFTFLLTAFGLEISGESRGRR